MWKSLFASWSQNYCMNSWSDIAKKLHVVEIWFWFVLLLSNSTSLLYSKNNPSILEICQQKINK